MDDSESRWRTDGGWWEFRQVQNGVVTSDRAAMKSRRREDGASADFQDTVVTADSERAIATFLLLIATPDW